jgi:hypothetical protein
LNRFGPSPNWTRAALAEAVHELIERALRLGDGPDARHIVMVRAHIDERPYKMLFISVCSTRASLMHPHP